MSGKISHFEGLIPKADTQQESFLQKFPEYDGRGVVIAVLDTGVDPSLPGLQVTSDGLPKLIDCIDVTGANDIDTSSVKTLEDDVLIGLTGRKLKIPKDWKNPSKKFHLGLKPIYELYTSSLLTRIKNEKKTTSWNTTHSLMLGEILSKINFHEHRVGGTSENLSDRDERENLNYQLEFLRNSESIDDVGPVSDCIVWNDGEKWRACIDTSFRGRLSLCTVLTNFCDERKYGIISDNDQLVYCLNIHDNGNILEICVPSSPHGSHVASIACANFPNDLSKNGFFVHYITFFIFNEIIYGLAPGAQLVSIGIGDHRQGAMETGRSLTRALNKCVELGVDIINYSYGESTHFLSYGKVFESIEQTVWEKNVILIAAVGNRGPALGTADSPGGTSQAAVSVGAFLTSKMIEAMYCTLHDATITSDLIYPWSGRGPVPDGALGISIAAPGAAITGVPKYLLTGNQLMNGTSMASPNATGGSACLLSAMKALNIKISPFRFRLSIENSANFPCCETEEEKQQEHFSYGNGLLQIDSALELIKKIDPVISPSLTHFAISVSEENPCTRYPYSSGIYVREKYQSLKPSHYSVNVKPKFKQLAEVNEDKIMFDKNLLLRSDAHHVDCPKNFKLMSQERAFQICIDPTKLQKGIAHYSEVQAFDSENDYLGPLFRVPITVIVPLEVPETVNFKISWNNLQMQPARPYRRFLRPPENSVFLHYRLKSNDKMRVTKYVISLLQVVPDTSFRLTGHDKVLTLEPEGEEQGYLKLYDGYTLEICITKAWMNVGDSNIDFEASFHGVHPANTFDPIAFKSCDVVNAVNIYNHLRYEEVFPVITYRHLCQPLLPEKNKIEAAGPRDQIPTDGQQIFVLSLSYSLNVSKAASFDFYIQPLSELLYECPFETVPIQIFSSTKKYIGATGTYPNRYTSKLEKGNGYKIIVQFRHESMSFLENYVNSTLVAQQKLSQPITLAAYQSYYDALAPDGKKLTKAFGIHPGQNTSIYFEPISSSKMPKQATPGTFFTGSLCLAKLENELLRKAVQFDVQYHVVDNGRQKTEKEALSTVIVAKSKNSTTGFAEAGYRESMLSHEIKLLAKISDDALARTIFKRLHSDYPEHLPLLLAELKRLTSLKQPPIQEVFGLCDAIIRTAKPEEVLLFFGGKIETEEALLAKDEMEKRKSAIIESLIERTNIIADAHLKISTQEVTKIFRRGLRYSTEGAIAPSDAEQKKPKDLREDSSDEFKEPECAMEVLSVDDADQDKEVLPMGNKESVDLQENLEEVNDDQPVDESVTFKRDTDTYHATLEDLDIAYNQMVKWVDKDYRVFFWYHWVEMVLVLTAKHAVAHARYGIALRSLQKIVDEDSQSPPMAKMSLNTAIIELVDLLGWTHISNNLKNALIVEYRTDYRPF